jgi:hypothetical protein
MAKDRRTTHRSSKGTKLYAVRDASGRFKDIQMYERAHRADLAKTSKAEKTSRKTAGRRKTAKKRCALGLRARTFRRWSRPACQTQLRTHGAPEPEMPPCGLTCLDFIETPRELVFRRPAHSGICRREPFSSSSLPL